MNHQRFSFHVMASALAVLLVACLTCALSRRVPRFGNYLLGKFRRSRDDTAKAFLAEGYVSRNSDFAYSSGVMKNVHATACRAEVMRGGTLRK